MLVTIQGDAGFEGNITPARIVQNHRAGGDHFARIAACCDRARSPLKLQQPKLLYILLNLITFYYILYSPPLHFITSLDLAHWHVGRQTCLIAFLNLVGGKRSID